MRLIRSRDLPPPPPVDTRANRIIDTLLIAIAFGIAVCLLRGLFWWLAGV